MAEKRRLNHPNKVIERYKRQHPDPDTEPRVSPVVKLKQVIAAQEEELHRLKRAGDDDRFNLEDTAKNIAGTIVRNFTPSKATTIAREILALVKEGTSPPVPSPTRARK